MTNTQEYISKEKLAELTKELDVLKNEKRGAIAKKIEEARALGDLSENAEYHDARDEQGWLEDRIALIEHLLRTAKVVDNKKGNGSVSVGSKVTIQKKGEKTTREITIVGGEETDVATGKISLHSPLGEALLGKRVDDKAVIKTPKGETEYKITEVN